MMKETSRILSVLLISVLVMSLMAGIVVAQFANPGGASSSATGKFGSAITRVIDGLKEGGNPLFSALFGTTTGSQELFIQILAFMLVMFVVYGVLSTVNIFGEDRGWLNMLIGAIISIIGIRFIPDGFLTQMALPSSAFVAVLILGIPFVMLFYLIQNLPKLARRAIWTVYGVLLFFMWIYNYNTDFWYVYWVIIGTCFIAFWFDGVLGGFFRRAKTEKKIGKSVDAQERILRGDIVRLNATLANTTDLTLAKQLEGNINNKIFNFSFNFVYSLSCFKEHKHF